MVLPSIILGRFTFSKMNTLFRMFNCVDSYTSQWIQDLVELLAPGRVLLYNLSSTRIVYSSAVAAYT